MGLQRDVVYLGWPIAPSYRSPNAGGGGGGELLSLSKAVHRSPNNFWKSNSIFNPWVWHIYCQCLLVVSSPACRKVGRSLILSWKPWGDSSMRKFHEFYRKVFCTIVGCVESQQQNNIKQKPKNAVKLTREDNRVLQLCWDMYKKTFSLAPVCPLINAEVGECI